MTELETPQVFTALVKSLSYCVTDTIHEPYDPDFDDSFEFRDAAERLCLVVLDRLSAEFDDGPYFLIKAGFVHQWLAKEPWGDTDEERQKNIAHCCKKRNKLSDKLPDLIRRVIHRSAGLQQMIEAGLATSGAFSREMNDMPDFLNDVIDIRMTDGEGTAGELGVEGGLEGGPRPREHSAEERHLRRRHREAMVLNDGFAPIAVSDIIEREYESPIEERRT
jgi:hypothetical protein